MSKIDLHIHTNVSDDGDLTPGEIVEKCLEQEMELIAVTDHNSVRGVAETFEKAAGTGLKVISGVELDCTYEGKNFHLLGYGMDYTGEEFRKIEQDILMQERAAAREKIRLFREFTQIPVTEEEVLAASKDGVVPGELIAQIVLAKEDAGRYELLVPYLPYGSKSDMPNVRFYWDFFSEGKPAYVPVRYLSLSDAAALIHSEGGIAVLAHPGQNLAGSEGLLEGIVRTGIDGIEVFSSYHTKESADYYLEKAEQNNLIVTCGSDFHGRHKPNIMLGGHGASRDDEKLKEGFAGRIFV